MSKSNGSYDLKTIEFVKSVTARLANVKASVVWQPWFWYYFGVFTVVNHHIFRKNYLYKFTMSDSDACYDITEDPNLVSSRIFLGNLPNCTNKELKLFCQLLGKVLGSRIWGNYGFVQYETELKAQVAALILNGCTFKSHQVRCWTTNFAAPPMEEKLHQNSTMENLDFQPEESPPSSSSSGSRSSSLAKTAHPDRMQKLLEILARNLPLTESQYEEIIQYLEAEKKELWKSNEAAKRDVDLMNLLQDQRVQDA